MAQETATYAYDELGRLVHTSAAGGPRNGQQSDLRYDSVGNRTASAIINPLPSPPPNNSVFSITGPSSSINEGDVAVFTITRTGTASGNLSVDYATTPGTASTADFTSTSGTIVMPYWASTSTVSVQTIDDSLAEPAEQFTVNLSNPMTGATIGTAVATATIAPSDNNLPPVTKADTASVGVCSSVVVNVVANDTDPESNYPLALVSVGTSSRGSALVASSTEVMFSAAGTTGNTSITYTVKDSLGATATGMLYITITSGPGCN